MICKLVTAPAFEPVDLVTAKLHLKIDESAEASVEDSLVQSYIKAARQHVEDITRRALITSTWDYCLPCWPRCDSIKLPLGNLQNAAGPPSTAPIVSWKDTDGTATTLTVTTDYLVETNDDQCGRIVLPYGVPWPSGSLYPSNAITVRFVAGWTTAELVPFTIKAAILLALSDLYENRSAQEVGTTMTAILENKTVDRLLASSRLFDEF